MACFVSGTKGTVVCSPAECISLFAVLTQKSVAIFSDEVDVKLLKGLLKKGWECAGRIIVALVPVRRGTILFGQYGERYNGNSKIFFEFLLDEGGDPYWLYTSNAQLEKIPKRGRYRAVPLRSFRGFRLAAQSEFAVISHGGGDFMEMWHLTKHRTVLNLWHGITIKNLGALFFDNREFERYFKKNPKYYSLTVASSDIDRYVTAAAQQVDTRTVFVTGTPRQDNYIRRYRAREKSELKKILYAPTHRDYPLKSGLFFPFADYTHKSLSRFLESHPTVRLYLRPHPYDRTSVEQAEELERAFPEKVIHYSQAILDDIDEELQNFDLIVTDYSSIFMEPLLTDTPLIFVPFDIDRYAETRGFCYPYEMVTPGPKAESFAQFAIEAEKALSGQDKWGEKRKLVKELFFRYDDSDCCRRIATEVLRLTLPAKLSGSDEG